MPDPYPKHGRRWRWRTPLQFVCRCGTDAYPCAAKRMLDRNARTYSDGLRYASGWRDSERSRWDGRR